MKFDIDKYDDFSFIKLKNRKFIEESKDGQLHIVIYHNDKKEYILKAKTNEEH